MTRIALFRPMAMLLLALLPCAAASAQAPPPSGKYTFTNIVDNTGPYASFGFYGPAINDSGQVAFTATLDTGGWGIFTGDDPTTDTLVHDSGPINPFDQPLSISNSGLVGFVATADEDDDGVFIGSVGAGVTRIESGDLFDPQPHRSLAYGWQVKFVLMGDNGIVTYSHFENSRVVLRTAPPLATVEGFYADNALYNANGDLFGWSSEGLVKLPGGDPNLMETLTTLPAPQFAVNANGDAVIYNKIRLSPAAIYRVMK